MTIAYLLLVLVPVCAVAYAVWNYRRKIAQRDAQRTDGVIGLAAQAARAVHSNAPSDAAELPPGASTISYMSRSRVLTPPQTLLYYLLRSGLPDHIVFAQMTLASVLDTAPGVAPHARAEMARRLGENTVDFVVADRRMRPLVVVKLTTPEAERTELSSRRRWLAEAGVRYVELDARALPRKEDIREVVLGESLFDSEPAADETKSADAETRSA